MSAATAERSRDRGRFYDTIAGEFDAIMNRYDLRRRIEIVFDELLAGVELRGRRVLDAGCGTGEFSREACRRGARVTSLDIGRRLLDVTRGKCDADCVQGDVTALPLADGAFDAVICSECIEHTPDPRAAVHELIRVCRPGGHVVITCPNRVWHWACVMANRVGLRPYEGLENWPSRDELRRWIVETGGRPRMLGFHLVPFVFGRFNPLMRAFDRLGDRLGAMYVNQAALVTKTTAV